MKCLNVFDDALLAVDAEEPEGYRAPYVKVADHLDVDKLAASVVLLAPGQAVCPYHYELAEEEWLVVLEGRPTVRTPSQEHVLEAGDVLCFERGPAGAHRIANSGAQPARVLIVSEHVATAATVYEDSDKVGVFGPDMRLLFCRGDERDYWDGEGAQA